ncbi:hypothetical protein [Actinophytocola sp.]|uniref:hypothetical protein n=1 Tax=Actinophytocola sp. TaxID=1872138 RepID=UPI003C73279E
MLTQIMGRLSEAERKTLYSASVSQGGLTVQDGGAMRLRLDNGVDVFYAGPLHYDDPVVNYNGIIMRRPDGSPIFYTFPPGGDPNVIAWRFLDQDRNEVLASDAVTGGLAKPWIPLTGVPALSSAIPMTSNAGFIGTWATGSVPKQQPYVEVQALIRSESGGIGNARYTMNGTPVGSSMPIASGAFGWQSIQVLPIPGDFYNYISIELEVQRTNASGTVGGVFRGFQRQT